MKINSAASIETANSVFNSYRGSWTAAREAAHRDTDGVLVIPKRPAESAEKPGDQDTERQARNVE